MNSLEKPCDAIAGRNYGRTLSFPGKALSFPQLSWRAALAPPASGPVRCKATEATVEVKRQTDLEQPQCCHEAVSPAACAVRLHDCEELLQFDLRARGGSLAIPGIACPGGLKPGLALQLLHPT